MSRYEREDIKVTYICMELYILIYQSAHFKALSHLILSNPIMLLPSSPIIHTCTHASKKSEVQERQMISPRANGDCLVNRVKG